MKISFISRIFDLIAPRACVVCGRRLAITEEMICTTCNLHLPRFGFREDPFDNSMAQKFWGRIPLERALALVRYESGSKSTHPVLSLKYGDQPWVGNYMGQMMANELGEKMDLPHIDLIVPMPLAKNRQRKRGYNQSRELAKGIHAVTGIPIASDRLVERDSFKQTQTHLDRYHRNKNVENIFHLQHPEEIQGKHVLLVDDVVTTGASLVALGTELVKAGDVKLSILTWGNVVS